MERDYKNGSASDVTFFIGREIEKTPAYGKKTVFVVGVQAIETIEKILADSYTQISEPVQHIFFGANHSYNPHTYADYESWEKMITHFLKKDYFCSLDIPLNQVESFHEGGLCGYNKFIPQIRVPIPYVKLWNYNTMVKIDDRTFNSTNPGIWTHSLHDLMNRSKFTDWSEYKDDEIL